VEVVGSNPTAPTIHIFVLCLGTDILPHSHLGVAVDLFFPQFSPMQPDGSHWVDSEAGFIRSNCSMYTRWASNALPKFPCV
jgi:hypothetical protein